MYSGFLQGFAVTSWTLAVHSISDEEDSEFESGGESSCVSDDRGGLLKPPDRQQSWLQSERCRQDHKEEQESHAVAGKPRDAAVNSDRYQQPISEPAFVLLMRRRKHELASVDEGHRSQCYLHSGAGTAHNLYCYV